MERDEFLYYVETYYPVDYDIVGRSTTIQIIDTILDGKDLKIVTSKEGSNFGIVESIGVVALVIEVIKGVLEIIKSFKEMKEEVTVDKVKKKILEKISESDKEKIANEDLEQLIEEIVEKNKVED